MKVSICVITYQHERFLAQTLDSILSQERDFPVEILVGEDGSSDTTPDIVEAYAKKHPDLIKPAFYRDAEKILVNGRVTGRRNFLATLARATGEYVVIIDGDDFWTDARKLMRQVRFLDENPHFSGCFHNAICVNDAGEYLPHIAVDIPDDKTEYHFEDLIKGNCIPTMSCLFRNPCLRNPPDWLLKTDMADWPLHLITAMNGPLHYHARVQAAYRIHEQGIWHSFRNDRTKGLLSQIAVWEILAHAGVISDAQYRALSENNLHQLLKFHRKHGNKHGVLMVLETRRRIRQGRDLDYIRDYIKYLRMRNR